jgi:regulatory protein
MAFATIRRGASGDGFFAVPQEGSSFFISIPQFSLLGLREGQELTEPQFLALLAQVEAVLCRAKALAALAAREHSRFELQTKLVQKGFSGAVATQELAKLEEEGLLSDCRFARVFIESRQRRNPEGRFILQARLTEHGVSQEIIAETIGNWFSDEDAVDKAIKLAVRKINLRHSDDKRILLELRKKGFNPTEIRRALAQDDQA